MDGVCRVQAGSTYNTALLPRSEIEVADLGMYLGILLGVLAGFRMLALFALVGKARNY